MSPHGVPSGRGVLDTPIFDQVAAELLANVAGPAGGLEVPPLEPFPDWPRVEPESVGRGWFG
jgi:hypothetical protein